MSGGCSQFIDLGPEYNLPAEANDEAKVLAEDFKNQGNEAMKNLNYNEALTHYNQ